LSIDNRTLSASDISGDALLLYLHRRPLRQLGWFADSRMRLEHDASRRKGQLLWLYAVALVLGLVKLSVVITGGHAEQAHNIPILSLAGLMTVLSVALLPALLIVTGLSSAMTAYYLNQNARSLIHRYNTQERRITRWFEAFNAHFPIASLQSM